MESKLIFFVAFVTLAQSFFVLQSKAYDLSEEASATYTTILTNQEATVQAKFDGFNPVFDIVNRLAAIQVWNLKAETDDSTSQVAEALVRVKDAINYSLDAISFILESSCTDLEEARIATHQDLERIYLRVPMAVALARAGNFSEDAATIEDLRVTVQLDLANLVDSFYGSVRTCLDTEDEGILAAIAVAKTGSGNGLIYTANAVFNAIKIYAAAVYARSQDIGVITAIEDARSYAQAGLRADVEHKFSLIRALLINSELGLSDAAPELNSIQYTETVFAYRWHAAVGVTFETIKASLSALALGLDDTGNNDFSLIDAADARTAAKLLAGFQAIVDSVLVLNPNATDAAAAALESFAAISDAISARNYAAITASLSRTTTYDEALETIEGLRNESLANIDNLITEIFELVQIDNTWGDEDANETAVYRDNAVTSLQTVTNSIYDSVIILLEVAQGNVSVSKDIYTQVEDLQSEATFSVTAASYNIATARVTALTADLSG